MVKSQLWNEYRGALATRDARFMARWRRSLTPYDRDRLDRMIAEAAEQADDPTNATLMVPTPATSQAARLNRPIVVLSDPAALTAEVVQAYASSAETEARLRALASSSGRSLTTLRSDLKVHMATWALPPIWSIGSFCAKVRQERLSRQSGTVTHPFFGSGADDLV